MTQSYTTTETWSRTHARKVAGKVVADLRQMQQEYGYPTDDHLNELLEELVSYLADDYLDYVEYGFKRDETWVVALKYTAAQLGSLAIDDRSGGIRRGANVVGAHWHSYLVRNSRWWNLSQTERDRYEASLKMKRIGRPEPSAGATGWLDDRTYSSAGGGVRRSGLGGNS